ncbi:MAG: magnesium-translocating P-type ATPase [Propionibacteriaceae bacterium]|nr:magnesium-translocating P-type ATPase [Propionibacteriaceae bacterium]
MDTVSGLSSREAEQLLARNGPNVIAKEQHLSGAKAYFSRFRNPLVIILVIASGFSFFLGDVTSAVIIVAIVLVSVTLDFANTYRSEKAASALQKQVQVSATVMRDGKPVGVPLAEIVVGDVVTLEAGSLIPADGDIVETTDIAIDESSLTGESFPVAKMVGDLAYLGSSVTSGAGLLRVTATGANTEFSHVAAALHKTAPTEFDKEIARFSALIAKVTFGLVIGIFALNLILGHDTLLQSLLFSVALAVGLTPELLPLIITLNLTKGSLEMAKKGVIVKKLSAIQNFGSMGVLCTDKTGTLTENRITVARHMDFSRQENEEVLRYAYLACQYSTAYESPLDAAIIAYREFDLTGYQRVQEIPFDFQRKRESVVATTPDGDTVLIAKGAPEEILKILTGYADSGQSHPLDDASLASLQASYESLSRDGFRSLAIATKSMGTAADTGTAYGVADESGMTFTGFIAFIDPPKESAAAALSQLRANGIEVKIITGDDPLVSAKVAGDLNLDVTGILTGDQIAKMNKVELGKQAEKTTIFARVNPSQKLAVIEALRLRKHVVGYMGDGINDAPSLRAADIGISVNNAVDVAKDTADLILLNKSLAQLNDGVVEGRHTFANTLKYLMMGLSSNFGNMFSMAGASLFLPFLPMTAPQILFNNLLYDTSQFAIPSDSVDEEMIAKPRTMDLSSLKKFMWVFGPLSSVFDFATFGIMLLVFHATAPQFQTGWFIESLMTQTLVVYVIRTRRIPFVQSRPSWPLLLSVVAVIVVALATIFSFVGSYFGFAVLAPGPMIAIALLVLAYLVVAEVIKHAFYRRVHM